NTERRCSRRLSSSGLDFNLEAEFHDPFRGNVEEGRSLQGVAGHEGKEFFTPEHHTQDLRSGDERFASQIVSGLFQVYRQAVWLAFSQSHRYVRALQIAVVHDNPRKPVGKLRDLETLRRRYPRDLL